MRQKYYKYIWYSSALLTLCWFVTSMYLPILPHLAYALSTSTELIKTTVSVFFIFFCIGQFIFGPLSDNYSRCSILIITLLACMLGAFICAISTKIWMFMLGRCLQGIGIGAAPALTRSMINDVYEPSTVMKLMIYLTSIVAIATAIGPLVGAFFFEFMGWRSLFIFQFIFSLILISVQYLCIQKSYPTKSIHTKNHIFKNYLIAIKNGQVLFYVGIYSIVIGSLVAFYSASPFLLIKNMHMSMDDYAALLLIATIFYLLAVVIVRLLFNQITAKQMLLIGICTCLLAGSMFLIFTLIIDLTVWSIILSVAIYLLGAAFIPPVTNASAMQTIPHLAGTISSLLGAALALSSGILSYLLINLPPENIIYFALFFFTIPFITLIYYIFNNSADASQA